MDYPIHNLNDDRLSILLKVGTRLAAERNLDHLLSMIIEETTLVMEAERSSLFLIDQDKSEMWAKIAQGVETVEIRFPIGAGIAGTVGKTGELINIPDAYQDTRFNPAFDVKTGFRTRSILCVPMKNFPGNVIGAIQVLNKKSGTFQAGDEDLLKALASQASVAIDNADLYQKLHALNLSLEQKVRERTSELVQANERLSVLNRELEETAVTDALTQVYNRRYFMDRLTHEVKRALRYNTPVSLLMFDIDHFKKVNDTYGHQAGDAVLAGIADALRTRLRGTDLLARYGGEEFCLVAAGTPQNDAVTLADRLREKIAASVFEYGNRQVKVTTSIGVASWTPAIGDNHEELIKRADEALYRAKAEGRNRVCI